MQTGKETTKAAMAEVAAMPAISKELIVQFVIGSMNAEAFSASLMAFK